MGCTISTKTFNLHIKPIGITHKLEVRMFAGFNCNMIEIKNKDEIIQFVNNIKKYDCFGQPSFDAVIISVPFKDIRETVKIWYYGLNSYYFKPPNRIRLYLDDVDCEDDSYIKNRISSWSPLFFLTKSLPTYLILIGFMILFIYIGISSGNPELMWLIMIPVVLLLVLPCIYGKESCGLPTNIDVDVTATNQPYQHPEIQLYGTSNTLGKDGIKPYSPRRNANAGDHELTPSKHNHHNYHAI